MLKNSISESTAKQSKPADSPSGKISRLSTLSTSGKRTLFANDLSGATSSGSVLPASTSGPCRSRLFSLIAKDLVAAGHGLDSLQTRFFRNFDSEQPKKPVGNLTESYQKLKFPSERFSGKSKLSPSLFKVHVTDNSLKARYISALRPHFTEILNLENLRINRVGSSNTPC